MNKNKTKKRASARRPKVSKTIKTAVKQVLQKEIESKTINVPVSTGLTVNSVNTVYPALSGVQYLATDVFSLTQGVEDSSVIGAPNRIGDRVKGVGFLMDYYFQSATSYPIASTSFFIPFVKLRITVFKQPFGIPPLTSALLYDTNFLNVNTSTLQPINWNEGYVKDVLYDKVHILRNNLSVQGAGSGTFPNVSQYGQVFHFKKYFKYPHLIKYNDNNTANPNSTDKPIYIAISAEVDDASSGLVPSGTKILWTTGYTRAWFKDT